MKTSRHKIVTGMCSITAILITLTTGSISAQNSESQDHPLRVVELGFRFMPTISSFDVRKADGDIVEGESVIGYGMGGMLAVNLSKNIGVQAEVIYNSFSQEYKDRELDRKVTVDYINIPLMLSLNTDKRQCVNLNLVAGPQIGLNVGSHFETSGSAEPDTLTAVVAVHQGDLGFAYGAGLDFCLNSSHTIRLDVGFRGVHGLLDISDDSATRETNSYYVLGKTSIMSYSAYIGLALLF